MKLQFVLLVGVMSVSLAGCLSDIKLQDSAQASSLLTFGEAKAVEMVLRDHPDFPKVGGVKKIETQTGGPAPAIKVNGELKTTVEKLSDNVSYVITLTKDWNDITVGGNQAKSIWKYQVSADKMELLSSVLNDNLVHAIR